MVANELEILALDRPRLNEEAEPLPSLDLDNLHAAIYLEFDDRDFHPDRMLVLDPETDLVARQMEHLLDHARRAPNDFEVAVACRFQITSSPAPRLGKRFSERSIHEEEKEKDICEMDFNAVQKMYFEKILVKTNGNRVKAAKRANMKKSTLVSALERLGIKNDYGR